MGGMGIGLFMMRMRFCRGGSVGWNEIFGMTRYRYLGND